MEKFRVIICSEYYPDEIEEFSDYEEAYKSYNEYCEEIYEYETEIVLCEIDENGFEEVIETYTYEPSEDYDFTCNILMPSEWKIEED